MVCYIRFWKCLVICVTIPKSPAEGHTDGQIDRISISISSVSSSSSSSSNVPCMLSSRASLRRRVVYACRCCNLWSHRRSYTLDTELFRYKVQRIGFLTLFSWRSTAHPYCTMGLTHSWLDAWVPVHLTPIWLRPLTLKLTFNIPNSSESTRRRCKSKRSFKMCARLKCLGGAQLENNKITEIRNFNDM